MKQEDKGTVAISLVAYSVALATRRGVAAEPLLAQAGIAPALLGQPRARVSAQQYGALWNAIARTLDDEFFGQDRHPMRSGSFIAMSQAALSARDGLHAMARAVNFMHCVLDDLHAEPTRIRSACGCASCTATTVQRPRCSRMRPISSSCMASPAG